ncbi:hypothetical protein J4476_00170 [Candidatus Woesearchaeota archaeon]|nr:MAG: hypothetical protein QT09_C0010G0006 [archaeon GW2011_AR18]MBS3161099.1 hypothetical protein [Candidatus Woesearchaeota archaeon]HIH25507.1 hypothetical protein [Nanoarchaeota archaeon]
MVSPLEKAVLFFKEFGLFDVVLPFLLVFSIVFALLEKSMILGVEKINNKDVPKKALNTTVAFVVAMLVIATNKIVSAINNALPNIVLLIVIIISFLMLIGSFYKTGEFDFFHNDNYNFAKMGFFFVILIVVILIFANSIMRTENESWLEFVWNYFANNLTGTVVTSLIFLAVAIGAVLYVTNSSSSSSSGGKP